MKIVAFWRLHGLIMGSDSLALPRLASGSLPSGDLNLAWTCQQGPTNTTSRQPTRPPSRCRLGFSDVAATFGRKNTRNSRSNPSDSDSELPMLTVVEPTGAAKRKPPSKRRKSFGTSSPNSTPGWTSFPRKDKKKADLPALVDNPSFAETPANHGYTAGVITLFLGLVQLGVSLRATSRVLDFMARFFGLPFSAPDWTTGRMWLLRFGLAQLNAPKDQADDWAWLIDHSVQIGKQKVLAIVGIRLLSLPMPERFLKPDDLVLIELVPMETSTREDVAARLEATAARTMVPRAIVDDHGVV